MGSKSLFVYPTEQEVDKAIAQRFIDIIQSAEHPKIGMATGSTPIGVYQKLVEAYDSGELSFKDVTSFNLDEYIGMTENNPSSFSYFMNTHLFDHIDIKSVHMLKGDAQDPEEEAKKYENLVCDAGPFDLQLLGIGVNGHIGFNEPGPRLYSETHIVELTKETIKANAKSFPSPEEVPSSALTLGMGTIMKAKVIIFMAKGEEKAEIVRQVFEGPITTQIPGSLLQLHPNVEVYLDAQAASKLSNL